MDKEKDYHIDKMRINTRKFISELKKNIPFKELEVHSKRCYLKKASIPAQLAGFKSSINVVLPTKEFFRILQNYENDLSRYKISAIEITEDTFYNTKYEAEKAFQENHKTGEKKWSTKSTLYEGDFYQREKDGKWYYRTSYLGKGFFEFRVYPRISKVNNQPCLHREFRLLGAYKIKNKTGIVSIKDLVDFNAEETFSRLEDRYINHCKIDMLKLGKFLKNKTRIRKLSEEEEKHLGALGRFYCKLHNIKTYQDLKQRLSVLKKSIRSKKGRKSDCEAKIEKTQYGYFKK